jgi:hypothetical protein
MSCYDRSVYCPGGSPSNGVESDTELTEPLYTAEGICAFRPTSFEYEANPCMAVTNHGNAHQKK